jgi:signal transduction histidine kinase
LREAPNEDARADLGKVLRDSLDRATRQWGVKGIVGNYPKSVRDVGAGLQRQLQHLLSESVANAVKHGKAANVTLSAEVQDGELVMVLEDDGEGVHIEGTGQTEPSPWSLYERVRELGGTLALLSHGRGSQVRFSVPWSVS